MKLVRVIAVNLLVLAGLLVLAAIGVEGWTRLRPRNVFVQFDPVLGDRLRPNTDGVYRGTFLLSPNPYIRTAIHIDSLGVRGPDFPLRKPPGTRRVLVIGDSYVEAFEVPYDSTFYARLSRMAVERGTAPLQTIPAGVMGYGTAQELLWLRENGARFAPDLIILSLFMGNDVSDNSRILAYSGGRPYFDLDGDSLKLVSLPNKANWLKYWTAEHVRSYLLYKELGYRLSGLRGILSRLSLSNDRPAPSATDPDLPNAYRLTFALVGEMRREATNLGSQFAVAYSGKFPTAVTDNSDTLVARFCSTARIDCVNLNRALAGPSAKTPYGWDTAYFIPNDEHWTSAGHRVVADEMWRAWSRYFTGQ